MRSSYWLLLVSLYFSQGLPFGFFTQALPVILRQREVDLAAIGLANLLALPWALKFLWAPAVDAVPGPRRRVILPLQLAAAALMAALAGFSVLPVVVLVGAVVLTNTLAATQDIATDGLAVELLPPGARGLGNSVQVAGYRLGMILGGGAMLVLLDELGGVVTFLGAAGALLLATLPLLLGPVPPRAAHPAPPRTAGLFHVWASRPGAWAWMGVLAAYKLGDAFGTGMVKPFCVDRGMDLGDVGWMLGVLGSGLGLLGALIGGRAVARWGPMRTLLAFGTAQVGTMMGYVAASTMSSVAWIWIASAAEHLVSGMATVTLFTAMMDRCRPGQAGTDYTVQASVVVISQGLAAALSGFVAEALGWPLFFAASAGLCALAVLAVARLRAPAPFGWAR